MRPGTRLLSSVDLDSVAIAGIAELEAPLQSAIGMVRLPYRSLFFQLSSVDSSDTKVMDV